MSIQPEGRPSLTIETYLELEADSPVRHEYVAGAMYALAGVSKRHNRIAGNLYRLLSAASASSPYRVYIGEVKLRVGDDASYYPDVMVACGADGPDPYVEDAPCLVAEVLSPSTEAIDRREKLAAYKRLASLRVYLVVHQDRRRVERFWRDEAGVWWDADTVDQGIVPLPCPEVTLGLDEIYAGVDAT